MYINFLSLKDFRNYELEYFQFKNGINILTGANAQGKTNVAEAIFLLCTGYSPRANKDKYFVRYNREKAEITGNASSVYGDVAVKLTFDLNDKKRVFVNGLETLKIGEILGNINSVFFNPQELKLVQESPEDRRRFMNISLSQMSKTYFYALGRYNKILAQRNNLLKDKNEDLIRETLPVWDMQLAKYATTIIRQRNDFLTELSPLAEEKHAFISDGKEVLKMKTESSYYGSEEEVEYAFREDLKLALDKDIRLGFTTLGPHRDDIKFTTNGIDVRIFGSQGQQRTVALSLKLAEAELFMRRFGEYPVLILDDVLSELDKSRCKKLIKAIDGIQTIFTATELPRGLFTGTSYRNMVIENGKIKKIKDI